MVFWHADYAEYADSYCICGICGICVENIGCLGTLITQNKRFNGYFPWIGYVVSFRIVLTSPMRKW